MKGWLLKKATTTYLGMANWQRRYLWLKDDKLYFYDEESEVEQQKAKKVISMRTVHAVCNHYDERAPTKSKKLQKGEKNDKSRFDVYAPQRTYNLKSEVQDEDNSHQWLVILQRCAAYYNTDYNTRFIF